VGDAFLQNGGGLRLPPRLAVTAAPLKSAYLPNIGGRRRGQPP